MIIQKVAKGISIPKRLQLEIENLRQKEPRLHPDKIRDKQINLIEPYVQKIFEGGILCNWWLNLLPDPLPYNEIPYRLTDRNLYWHQNSYTSTDPLTARPFSDETPFISTTAGTTERRSFLHKNKIHRARNVALRFATNRWKQSGIIFFCYVFIIGKQSIGHQGFAEELRELNIYTGYSQWQPEGEITAKIIIPPAQIECAEIWLYDDFRNALRNNTRLQASYTMHNHSMYLRPDAYHNIRELF